MYEFYHPFVNLPLAHTVHHGTELSFLSPFFTLSDHRNPITERCYFIRGTAMLWGHLTMLTC
jgi:hypothetical protein